ncbi:hypothetical protein ACP70R_007680 [Stipagrostis hirtigluma subsp. patula]
MYIRSSSRRRRQLVHNTTTPATTSPQKNRKTPPSLPRRVPVCEMGNFLSWLPEDDDDDVDRRWPTIVAETAEGSHILRITGYTETTRGHGVGRSIDSGEFTAGGHTWHIAFFPDGEREECADWVSVYLYLDRPAARDDVVKASFVFRLLDQNGLPVSKHQKFSPINEFSLGGLTRRWGYRRFIEKQKLEKWLYSRDDVVQIRCDVTVVKEARVETTTVPSSPLVVPPPDMHRHFGGILASGIGADVTIMVGGELFAAHRIVLAARSTVFMAELFGHMKEKDATCIQIDDMDARVFRAMLHFIYTDTLPEIDGRDKISMAQHLLVAADRYDLERLKLICEDILTKYVDGRTVATTLVLAEQHGFHGLKEACLTFLKFPGSRTKVMASDGFLHLRLSCPLLFEEVLTILTH